MNDVLKSEIETLTPGFDLLSDHIVITDSKGILLYMNPAAEKKTGYSLEDIIGQKGGKIWGNLMERKFYETLWDTISVQKKPFSGDVKNKKKDGTEYWAELRITPVLDDAGEVRLYIGIEPEITERKMESNEIKQNKDALYHYLAGREVRMVELKKQIRSLKAMQ